ncbi:MAG: hypothetical protein WC069_03850 [Candidatus Shapirobacteria bacterium]
MKVQVSNDSKSLDKIEKRLDNLELDVSVLKSDVSILKSDVSSLKVDVRDIKDSLLEWKSEMFNALDVFMSETKDQRDFRLISSNQIVENRERTDRLEKKVFGSVLGA